MRQAAYNLVATPETTAARQQLAPRLGLCVQLLYGSKSRSWKGPQMCDKQQIHRFTQLTAILVGRVGTHQDQLVIALWRQRSSLLM